MNSIRGRLRPLLWVLPVLLTATFVTSVSADGLFGMGLPGLPSFGVTSWAAESGGLVVSADAKIGYGHIGLNFSLPISVAPSMDLAFRDANIWIGSVEARIDSWSGFFLALRGQGNASRLIGVATTQDPLFATRWDGSKLQWWELEGNIGYRVRPGLSVLVGLRRDQLSVGLTNPRANGVPLNVIINNPLFFLSQQSNEDFSSKLWIPYFGLEIAGQRYRATLLYSPFASADIRVPKRFFESEFDALQPSVAFLK